MLDLAGAALHEDRVPTPLVYVDSDVLERNVAAMADAARGAGVALRPHAKTHKLAEIAQLQLAAGAAGLTVAKLAEAEALLAAGVDAAFMVAQPYAGAANRARHHALARRAEVIGATDDPEHVRAHARPDEPVDYVLIVDTGYGRFGVPPAHAVEAASTLAATPGVRFRGIRSHTGNAYTDDAAERTGAAVADITAMTAVAAGLRARGVGCEIVSVGSTPGIAGIPRPDWGLVTEWRPGNYVFYDRMQVALGVAAPEDCALRLLVTVISTAVRGQAVIDAGKKSLTSTPALGAHGYGVAAGRRHLVVDAISEECGWIPDPRGELTVGDRLELIPNHSCELTNLAPLVAHGRGARIEGVWEPVARAAVW
jgi:D-serine deaminase-like pyridoxal phosphate-dependent protein